MTLFSFPNPVNEKAARVVAGGVALLAAVTLATGWLWLTVVLALGFVARVLSGPRWSPLGQFATRVVAPRLGAPKLVAGPPKRFAQGIGLVVTTSAAVLGLALGASGVAFALVAMLLVFAVMESGFGFCAGCWMFGRLMALGVVPESACEACHDIRLRVRERAVEV